MKENKGVVYPSESWNGDGGTQRHHATSTAGGHHVYSPISSPEIPYSTGLYYGFPSTYPQSPTSGLPAHHPSPPIYVKSPVPQPIDVQRQSIAVYQELQYSYLPAGQPHSPPSPHSPTQTQHIHQRSRSQANNQLPSQVLHQTTSQPQNTSTYPQVPIIQAATIPSHHPSAPVRPFACDMCNLSFNRQHDLKRHRETHSGDKPFCCNGGCGKTFTRKDALKRHQLVKGCGKVDEPW